MTTWDEMKPQINAARADERRKVWLEAAEMAEVEAEEFGKLQFFQGEGALREMASILRARAEREGAHKEKAATPKDDG